FAFCALWGRFFLFFCIFGHKIGAVINSIGIIVLIQLLPFVYSGSVRTVRLCTRLVISFLSVTFEASLIISFFLFSGRFENTVIAAAFWQKAAASPCGKSE
ncbi:MAG: hypothetical protein ACOYIO_03940, partial [Eubacteriales bacterium]